MTRHNPTFTLEVIVDRAAWEKAVPNPSRLCRAAARAAAKVARVKRRSSAALELVSDRRMKRLNRDFRGYDKPTNVLAFPAGEPLPSGKKSAFLGDIAIALETVRREAKADDKPIRAHLAHLVVHGVLHLMGYHHDNTAAAERMERLERIALKSLGLPDPYAPAEGAR